MQQLIETENRLDGDENPAGGWVHGVGFDIVWQEGPLGRGDERREPNGAFVETVLAAALQRIEFYNEGKFRCRENSLAITHIQEAMHWLHHRTADREVREVEGTHEA